MKKRELAVVAALLTAVSTICIKGMKSVGERLSHKENIFEDLTEDENGTSM